MRVSALHIVERAVVALATLAIFGMIGILFYFLSLRLGHIAKENQTYDHFISCVLSVPALDRDQNKINQCYNQAEKDTNIRIKRFDGR